MSSDIDHAARDRRGAPLHDILLATFDKTDDLHRAAALRALQRKESRVRGSENTFLIRRPPDQLALRLTVQLKESEIAISEFKTPRTRAPSRLTVSASSPALVWHYSRGNSRLTVARNSSGVAAWAIWRRKPRAPRCPWP